MAQTTPKTFCREAFQKDVSVNFFYAEPVFAGFLVGGVRRLKSSSVRIYF